MLVGLRRGFSLIELMIGLALLAILLAIGVPSLAQILQNSQIKTAAEGLASGIQQARAEALRRNATIRFQLMDSLTASCSAASNGTNWVISRDDAANACDAAPDEAVAPRLITRRSGAEGSANAEILATGGAGLNHVLIFNGLGRPVINNPNGFTTVDITNGTGGDCEHLVTNGTMRCLRIQITSGGDTRTCDPKVSDTSDPRKC